MKKTKLALAISTAVFASSAMATNGTNMIGVGTQANALGGTGTAAYFGSESGIINPALIGKTTGTDFSFGGTVFMPSVDTEISGVSAPVLIGDSKDSSSSDLNVIPAVSLATRINDNWTFGIGMFGTSGMGVDYSDNAGLFNAQTNLQIMKFVPTLAYNDNNFGIGFSPVIQYGSLDINYDTTGQFGPGGTAFGHGMATDLGYGFNIGGYFDVTKDTTIAASYHSQIDMKYDGQLNGTSGAAAAFGLTDITDKMSQPAEINVGIAHTMGKYMITADLKQTQWGQADGYKDFNWKDQNSISLGAKYTGNNYWAGIGYNKGDKPIETSSTSPAINMFNNIFFPATVEQHFTLGGGYSLSKNTMLEGAIVYAPEIETKEDVSAFFGPGAVSTTKHSQLGYTVSVKMNF